MQPIPETRRVLDQLLAEGDPRLAAALLRMGRRAEEIVPGSVGLSLCLSEDDLTLTLVASSPVPGVASSLTLPILRSGTSVGSVTVYAAAPDAFAGHHDDLAEALGVSARGAVVDADLGFSTRLEAIQGPQRLADQYDVDIALGLIAESQHVRIPVARERLRQAATGAMITEGQAARAVRGVLSPGS